ncbi:hypothetical protein BKA80DRAFT_107427 [Phyllosticta citrichinensis]
MPELHAFPSHRLPTLPDPPSEDSFRDFKRMPLDCCRDFIYSTAREIDEIEDAVPIFKLSRDRNPHVDLLKFSLDHVLINGTDDAGKLEEQFDGLHLFEDVFYITAVKIHNLYSDLRVRFANGFIQLDTQMVNGITAASMLNLLWLRWGSLFDLEVLATLNFAVRKENLFAFKTKHNAEVFMRSKRFRSRYTRPTAHATIRRALNRYAFNENELSARIPGLHKLTDFNPAALAAHVQQKNSTSLAAWDHTKEILEYTSRSPALANRHDSMELDVTQLQTVNTISTTTGSPVGAYGFPECSSVSPNGAFVFSEPNIFVAAVDEQDRPRAVTQPTPWLGDDSMDVDQETHQQEEEEDEDEAMEVIQDDFMMDAGSTQDDGSYSLMDFVLQPNTYTVSNTTTTTPPAATTATQKAINHSVAAKQLNVLETLKELAGPQQKQQLVATFKSKAAIRKENFIKKTELELAQTKARHPSLDSSVAATPSPHGNPESTRPQMQLLAPTIYGQDTNATNMGVFGGLTFGAAFNDTPAPKPTLQRSRSPVMTMPSTTAEQHAHDQQHNAGRLERHRERALLKLEGKLQPDVDMKAWNYRDTCRCADDCQCAYWCRKEPWHMCACQRPAARVRVTKHIEDDAISVASTIGEEVWTTWERETGRKKWW